MNTKSLQFALGLCFFVTVSLTGIAAASEELSAGDKEFLNKYEDVRAALAADNLAKAKESAAAMGEDGQPIAQSDKISAARTEFAKLSERALALTKGQSGYYHVNCPMLKKDWVQTSTKISNPYAGKQMPDCGVIKK